MSGLFNAIIGFLARASNQLSAFLLTIVAARFLEPSEFGIFAIATIGVTLIRVMLYNGSYEYLLKAPIGKRFVIESLFVNIALSLIMSCILYLLTIVGRKYDAPHEILSVMIVIIPSNLISAFSSWRECLLLRSQKIKLYYIITTFTEIISLVVAVILLNYKFGVFALVWQIYVRAVLMLILTFISGRVDLSLNFSWSDVFLIVRWSSSRYISCIMNFLLSYTADIMLGFFLSAAAAGYYRLSHRIVSAVTDLFANPIRLLAMTYFSKRFSEGRSSKLEWPVICSFVIGIGWSALIGLSITSNEIVKIVLGEQWEPVAKIIPILALASCFALIDSVLITLLVAYNYQMSVLKIQTVNSFVIIASIMAAASSGIATVSIVLCFGMLCNTVILIYATFYFLKTPLSDSLKLLPLAFSFNIVTAVGSLSALWISRYLELSDNAKLLTCIAGGSLFWIILAITRRQKILYLESQLN